MVAGAAAEDAVRRAHAMPSLRVGLHLVVVDGPSVSPPAEIPDLVDGDGRFPPDQVRLGFRYFFRAPVRRQLAHEIRAQFAAFAATGLKLDHANAHKHMHLHPTVGRMMIDTGREFGLRAVRIPAEPPATLALLGTRTGIGDRALYAWTWLLRRQARAGWNGHQRSLLRPRVERPHDARASRPPGAEPTGRDLRNLFPSGRRNKIRP